MTSLQGKKAPCVRKHSSLDALRLRRKILIRSCYSLGWIAEQRCRRDGIRQRAGRYAIAQHGEDEIREGGLAQCQEEETDGGRTGCALTGAAPCLKMR